ncbi:molybdenum cofactor guanylyltransferase [Flavihumibacter profundi]|jgi:molybdenum cofactor guanylyltransferase|uniref:molybdenum cofactor guanylyltransferase n=1 Tax=Flavihumibacter profundi TaxID=2716883 RepID=UPI001CC6AF6A|nr:molybdenum cofactor guanylyltransferase [Flavihumibacter profundi]MBZ5857371.1 molybdenum cofactor guanylyltransferase [Flavihumibacter profundi]
MATNNLQGVVFCGGESQRMGSDKGMLQTDTGTWVQNSVALLSLCALPVIISVNPQQVTQYAEIFPREMLVEDNSRFNMRGPVCGLLSVHEKYAGKDLLILACDMPLMNKDVIQNLIDSYTINQGYEGYVFIHDNKPEPLCAIYCSKALKRIADQVNSAKLIVKSMKYLISQMNCFYLNIPGEMLDCFRNMNSPDDLAGM